MINMKNWIICLLVGSFVFGGCQQPDKLTPPIARLGINSITATFEDGTGSFVGNTPETGNEIVIIIPFYFPENSDDEVTPEMLKKMRVRANLDDNVTIDPPILYMDLTQTNSIMVTDQQKNKKEYLVSAEIRKSNACVIEEFSLPSAGISAIINETTKVISIPGFPPDEPVLANLRLSPHATISPDPRVTALNYMQEHELTVTAHDGVTKTVYTVKNEIPPRLPYGIRPNSAKIMFVKQLKGDLGISVDHLTGGFAATNDYVIINTRGEKSIYLESKTGEIVGDFDLGDVKGGTRNFYTTADETGNVLICNLAQNDGTFKVWRLNSITTGATQLYIDWADNEDDAIGRKISVYGNLDENAIITSPLLTGTDSRFARWTVVGGQLTSQTPEIITIEGHVGWSTNCDIIYTSATATNSDYFAAAYSQNMLSWVNGVTNQVRSSMNRTIPDDGNWITNAVDYVEFNNAKYLTTNWINSFNWGSSDIVWLMDVTTQTDFTGNLSFAAETCPAVVWQCPRNTYGAWVLGIQNTNGTGDVALCVSPDGYYLYLYFMFTNGSIVGVQFDCIDM